MKKLKVAIAGLGTVGKSVYEILSNDSKSLFEKHNVKFEIIAASARSKKSFLNDNVKFYDNPIEMVKNEDIDVVIEVIGGNNIAKDLIINSVSSKKHFITANKALLAEHGYEIAKIADKNNVNIGFEASTVGALPIIKSFKDNFAAVNDIKEFYGILNGTCNFILTKMEEEGKGFNEILKEAQEKGYAEADPTFDIKGIDSGHKLAILSSIAYGSKPNFKDQHIEGIDNIDISDIELASDLGYKIKLLGVYKYFDQPFQAVYPALIDKKTMIAKVDNTYNTVATNCSNAGWSMLVGHGAGGMITASAIVADLVDIANDHNSNIFLHNADSLKDVQISKIENRIGNYMIKIEIKKENISKDRELFKTIFENKFNIDNSAYITCDDKITAGFIISKQKESEISSFVTNLVNNNNVISAKFIRVENLEF